MSKIKMQYHYFYKITNKVNYHFYYGVHNTNNLDDGYMGSGKRLKLAYKKYGIENFEKEILKYFNSSKEAFEYEAEIVTEELIKDTNCYNLNIGGDGGWEYLNKKYRYVVDKFGNHLTVEYNDPRLLSGELKQHDKGIPKDYLKNQILVKDKNGNFFRCSIDDPRYISGELIAFSKDMVTVKDNLGNTLKVSIYDPRYLSGELVVIWKNRKHSEETKQKMKQIKQSTHPQLGEKNSQYGTCWIYNDELRQNKKIKKEELNNWINNGWNKGSKLKYCNKIKNKL